MKSKIISTWISIFIKKCKRSIRIGKKKVYRNIQSEMLLAYWQIGKMIVEKQGGESKAKFGDGLIKELSVQMTKDFGGGFDKETYDIFEAFI